MAHARPVATSPIPERAGMYLRISDDREGSALGVRRQEEDCRALAKKRGWTIAETYVDNDTSAYSGKPRPAYRQMLADMRAGVVDAVIAYHTDRLVRQPRELEEFIDIADASGIRHLATVTGDIDLSTHDGRFHARILGAVARKESDDKSRRIRRKHEELAKNGKVAGGGDRPFGFEDDRRTVRASEAAFIRDGARRLLAGQSVRSIVRAWNAAGSETTAGRTWYTSAVRRVLMSARIAGMREHHGVVITKAEWPGIVTAAQSQRLRAVLGDPTRRRNLGARRYLLAGLLRCGLCGKRLHARPRGDHARCYVCASGPGFDGCGRIRRLSEPVEELVTQMVIAALDTPELARFVREMERRGQQERHVEEEAKALELTRDQAAADFAAGKFTRREWLTLRDGLTRRLDAINSGIRRDQRTAAVQKVIGKGDVLAKRWPGLSLDERQSIIAAVVDHIVIDPAVPGLNKFDPTKIRPIWRA